MHASFICLNSCSHYRIEEYLRLVAKVIKVADVHQDVFKVTFAFSKLFIEVGYDVLDVGRIESLKVLRHVDLFRFHLLIKINSIDERYRFIQTRIALKGLWRH